MVFLGVGFIIGFLFAHMLPLIHNLESAWITGWLDGVKFGHIRARNDAYDEIIVEYDSRTNRYKRID